MRWKVVLALLTGVAAFLFTAVAFGGSDPPPPPHPAPHNAIYDLIATPLPGSLPSLGYEATSTSEFGDRVQFGGTNRLLTKVTVVMDSWGCASGHWNTHDCSTPSGATFQEPITVNFYSVGAGNVPGALLATDTQTFDIPYRPSADPRCTGAHAGEWYDAASKTCFNGLATPVTLDFTGQNVTLPDQAIVSVAYNTSDYGASPYGDSTSCHSSSGGCGYDSLNVALDNPATALSAGTNPSPDDTYLSSTWGGAYCDGSLGTGSFRLDQGCWTGYKPAIEIDARPTPPPPPPGPPLGNWKPFDDATMATKDVFDLTSRCPTGYPSCLSDGSATDSGLALQLNGHSALTVADITQLSTDWNNQAGCMGGGSPRFQIDVDTNGDGKSDGHIFVYLGTPGSFTDCSHLGTWQSTGNLADPTSSDHRVDASQLNAVGGAYGQTWQQAVTALGSYTVTGVQLVVDGGWKSPGRIQDFWVRNVTVDNTTTHG